MMNKLQLHKNDFTDVIQIGDKFTPVDDAVQSLQERGWTCVKVGINSAGNTVEIWRKGQNEDSKAR